MILKQASMPENVFEVVVHKNTEVPFSGSDENVGGEGTYICRQCGLALFRSASKFNSGCGWPSFDEEIPNHVKRLTDADGKRTEIVCARCNAHLGHVFIGEGFTAKLTRHCVNSVSLDFVSSKTILDTEEAIYAGGCFWGIEYWVKKVPGILQTEVGYTGGNKKNPTYREVCTGKTGHYEAVRIIYDPTIITYEALTKYFLEIHNPFQKDGQGPDIGPQYLSVIFYYDEKQKEIAKKILSTLTKPNMQIATQLLPVKIFWRAENVHQNYFERTGKEPYCHHPAKK